MNSGTVEGGTPFPQIFFWGTSFPIGGFSGTYLGRQVVLRPGGPRAGWGQLGSGERCEIPYGVWGGAPAEVEFGTFLP